MSNDVDTNPEAAALRGKRTKRTQAPQPGTTALSREATTDPDAPTTVYAAMSRQTFVLFDPAEMPPVVEIGGHVPDAVLADKYVRSEFDASETMVPPGCVTGVSRSLWQRGQHVRRDIYEDYVKRYGSSQPE